MKYAITLLIALLLARQASSQAVVVPKPNIVVVVADDMGWRDTGYSGNPDIKTPNLDAMASRGLRFDYFYASQQMCSPGRFSILTGRSPFRTGLHALGAMRPEEITIAKALKTAGYRTAHFGKWHLGSSTTSPVKMGFDEAIWKLNYYDIGASLQVGDTKEMVKLQGDTSVAAMDLALEFVRKQAAEKQPFFVQVCFGSPHSPHQTTEEFKALYKELPEKRRDFLGEVSGLDAAVGNLHKELKKLGLEENTIVWFTSDNGGITPQSQDPSGKGKTSVGARTVALLEWPSRVKPQQTSVPCGHVDIYPTLLDITGVTMTNQPPFDGISLVPLLNGTMKERTKPMGFMLRRDKNGKKQLDQLDFVADTEGVWIDGRLRLVSHPASNEKPARLALYDIFADPAFKNDLAATQVEDVTRMKKALDEWRTSVRASFDWKDYHRN